MQLLNLEQGSPEWHKVRSEHIGASDAPILMGVSPYKNPFQLWEEKMGLAPPQQETDAMRYGKEAEEELRLWFTLETGFVASPQVVKNGYMLASLDGITDDLKVALEIKCVNAKSWKEIQTKNILFMHEIQLQHIMYVCGLDQMYYLVKHKDNIKLNIIPKSQELIDKIITAEEKFYNCMLNFTPPEENGN